MAYCYFVSDLHGQVERYRKLFERLENDLPAALFVGGDILPSEPALSAGLKASHKDFVRDFLIPEFENLRKIVGNKYPRIFIILGNDDGRFHETAMKEAASQGIWAYMHDCQEQFGSYRIFGYAFVPPTPFLLKDWERYDISRFVDPGAVSPEEGRRTMPVPASEIRRATIARDLELLAGDMSLDRAVFLFHSPPYMTNLDRAALDGRMVDHVPLDLHVGSIAIQRFIENRQPHLTLHGHVHESARLTGSWRDKIGRTICLSAAHDGPELALVIFDLDDPEKARRELI